MTWGKFKEKTQRPGPTAIVGLVAAALFFVFALLARGC